MRLLWTREQLEDYKHCQRTDPKLVVAINALIDDIERSIQGARQTRAAQALAQRMVVASHHQRASACLSRVRQRRGAATRNSGLSLSLLKSAFWPTIISCGPNRDQTDNRPCRCRYSWCFPKRSMQAGKSPPIFSSSP